MYLLKKGIKDNTWILHINGTRKGYDFAPSPSSATVQDNSFMSYVAYTNFAQNILLLFNF
jgi:hypothetical protein